MSTRPVYAPPWRSNSQATWWPWRASSAHFDAFAEFCSSQKRFVLAAEHAQARMGQALGPALDVGELGHGLSGAT
jgi:hypothetical protein